MKAYGGSGGIDPFILNLVTGCGKLHAPADLLPRERSLKPIQQEAGQASVAMDISKKRKISCL
jgi:hypothetical protein